MSRGFTLIETLAVLLVVAIGLAAAIGLFGSALRLSSEAQGRSTAMATAKSVAVDPTPLLDPDLASDWTQVSTYNLDDASGSAEAHGYINGFWAVRRESAAASDILAANGAVVHARRVLVDVDISEVTGGRILASFSTWLVRTRNQP